MQRQFSSYVVGDDFLTIECCQQILAAGAEIKGIFSANEQILNAVQLANINKFDKLADLEQKMLTDRADYLFSISNKTILPESMLKAVRKLAINYHNAPLPKYAGTYATAWAILHNEKMHGITWHTMSSKIDTGYIVLQKQFRITAEDTMLTLNAKCHEYAKKTFAILIHRLASTKTLTLGKKITKVDYYPLSKRVEGDALIDWRQSADQIYRLYRSLNSYPYLNQLALPKLLIGNNFFIPRVIEVVKTRKSWNAGTIVKITDDYCDIATAKQLIRIIKITDMFGTEYKMADLLKSYHLVELTRLPLVSEHDRELLEQYAVSACAMENFWVRRIGSWENSYFFKESLSTDYDACQVAPESEVHWLKYDFKEICTKANFLGFKNFSDLVNAMLIATLYRLENYQHFMLGYADNITYEIAINSRGIYSAYLFLDIDYDLTNKTVKEVIGLFKNSVMEVRKHNFLKCDLTLRYPKLSDKKYRCPLIISYKLAMSQIIKIAQLGSVVVNFDEKKQELSLAIAKSIFNEKIVQKLNFLVEHMLNWFNALLAESDAVLVSLPFLSTEELGELQKNCIGHQIAVPSDWYVDEIIAQHAVNNANNVALIHGEKVLTYEELNNKANILAFSLMNRHGIDYRRKIAIYLEDNYEFIITILATLKIGACYLPLNVNAPIDVIKNMLQDAAIDLVISETGVVKIFEELEILQISYLDQIKKESVVTFEGYNDPLIKKRNRYSHIIFTSGSTGRSKGVAVSRANIANSLCARIKYYDDITAIRHQNMKVLLLLSVSFDTAVAAIFWPLVCAGQLVVMNANELMELSNIITAIKQQQITHIICTVSLYQSILQLLEPAELSSLKVVIVGGEKLNPEVVQEHQTKIPSAYLFNEYGVTEATINNTVKKIYDPSLKQSSVITIGSAFPNTSLYILDRYFQIVPPGLKGELFIGGASVTDGYINAPHLTEERFLELQVGQSNKRLYKTGDICSCTKEGLVFYERNDNQVKIRGFRIELDQIEQVLIQHPEIKQAVVLCTKFNYGLNLVAYTVLQDNSKSIDRAELTQFLAAKLPPYMIPAYFIKITHIPLTMNQKIDKRALMKLTEIQQEVGPANNNCVETKNGLIGSVLRIWCNIFKVNYIDINDSFFALGGHSLLISELMLQIKKHLGIKLKVKDFLSDPTVAGMVKLIERNNYTNAQYTKPEIVNFAREINCLVKSIKPAKSLAEHCKHVRVILLTGATGLLGKYLLRELLLKTDAVIYCIVRAINNQQATTRILTALTDFGVKLSEQQRARIVVWAGDLSAPMLGLDSEKFTQLCDEVDEIYHNGAYVHHIYTYELLKATNVGSTVELIRLATTVRKKKINYISTISTVAEIMEQDLRADGFIQLVQPNEVLKKVSNGYVQTKIISEHLLTLAHIKWGVDVNIYRPSWILWPDEEKTCEHLNNSLVHLIMGCFQMAAFPDVNLNLNVWPVDIISHFIVSTATDSSYVNQVFDLYNVHEVSWHWLVVRLNLFWNEHFKFVPLKQWLKLIENIDSYNFLFPLMSCYSNENSFVDGSSFTNLRLDNVKNALSALNMDYPNMDKSFLCNMASVMLKFKGLSDDVAAIKSVLMSIDLLKMMPGDLYLKDINGYYIECSDYMLKESGFTSYEQIIGKNDYDLFPKEFADRLRQNDIKVIQTGDSIIAEEVITMGGSVKHFQVIKMPLKNYWGKIVGIIGNSIDISERKNIEQSNIGAATLQALTDAQMGFQKVAEQMVHDIRSPLASILMIIETCKNALTDEVRRPLINAISRVQGIANRVLSQYRYLSEKNNFIQNNADVSKEVYIGLVLENIVNEKKYQYDDRTVHFDYHLDGALAFTKIMVNQLDFIRAVSNVLDNAVDACYGEKCLITIRIKLENNQVIISFKDNGRGMPQHVVEKIMQRIRVTHGKVSGNGLGYIQINGMIAQSSGYLQINSELQVGTEVLFVFPVINDTNDVISCLKVYQGDTIIILDDEKPIHDAWNIKFSSCLPNIRLQHFYQGEEAIRFINEQPNRASLIFLADYELYGQAANGIELIMQAGITRSLLVTGNYDQVAVKQAAAEKNILILPKPLAAYVQVQYHAEPVTAYDVEDNSLPQLKKDVQPKQPKAKAKSVLKQVIILDDDQLFVDALVEMFKLRKKAVKAYTQVGAFKKAITMEQDVAHTVVFLDYYLGNGIDGVTIAKKLYKLGYRHLYLLSGAESKISLPKYLKPLLKTDIDSLVNVINSLQ